MHLRGLGRQIKNEVASWTGRQTSVEVCRTVYTRDDGNLRDAGSRRRFTSGKAITSMITVALLDWIQQRYWID